ncbi:MAG TPA: MauE/DoxX family redox-associated membrane protein [Dehalococcoidia bacterium]|nr:MauE/DoxX family redox-associated membrane protein [Dehalococcoidia bacterium]
MAIRDADIDLEERARRNLPEPIKGPLDRIDRRLIRLFQEYGHTTLRINLGVVYIWFGALKTVDRSPVEDLVQDVIFITDASWVVPAVGVWEIVIGLGLIFPITLRIVLLMLGAQLLGTMSAFVVVPGDCFQDGNPLLLTDTGEFVLKNLVLLTAAIVIGSTVRRRNTPIEKEPPREPT